MQHCQSCLKQQRKRNCAVKLQAVQHCCNCLEVQLCPSCLEQQRKRSCEGKSQAVQHCCNSSAVPLCQSCLEQQKQGVSWLREGSCYRKELELCQICTVFIQRSYKKFSLGILASMLQLNKCSWALNSLIHISGFMFLVLYSLFSTPVRSLAWEH